MRRARPTKAHGIGGWSRAERAPFGPRARHVPTRQRESQRGRCASAPCLRRAGYRPRECVERRGSRRAPLVKTSQTRECVSQMVMSEAVMCRKPLASHARRDRELRFRSLELTEQRVAKCHQATTPQCEPDVAGAFVHRHHPLLAFEPRTQVAEHEGACTLGRKDPTCDDGRGIRTRSRAQQRIPGVDPAPRAFQARVRPARRGRPHACRCEGPQLFSKRVDLFLQLFEPVELAISTATLATIRAAAHQPCTGAR